MLENLPANAGDKGLSPGLGGSHMPQSNWAREPQLLSLRTRESPLTETKTQHSHKLKKKKKKSTPISKKLRENGKILN